MMRQDVIVSTSDGKIVVYRRGERYRTLDRHYAPNPADLADKRTPFVAYELDVQAADLPLLEKDLETLLPPAPGTVV